MNVKIIDSNYDFEIVGASYIGKPCDNTFMFASRKVEALVSNLKTANNCLVFLETGIAVDDELKSIHCFIFSDNPQLEYSRFSLLFAKEKEDSYLAKKYVEKNHIIYGEDVSIGEGTIIEPGCFIDHGVVIGNNCRIKAKSVIRNCTIGDNVLVNENALIGANGFNMAEDEDGNKMRIPTLGRVVIGDNCEIGAFDNISAGLGGDTVLENNVKIDALVYIGHDVYLHKNVEITAGSVIGGFVEIEEHGYVGIRSVLRNRIKIGENAFVGMGAVVTKSVDDGVTVVGNPAKPFERK